MSPRHVSRMHQVSERRGTVEPVRRQAYTSSEASAQKEIFISWLCTAISRREGPQAVAPKAGAKVARETTCERRREGVRVPGILVHGPRPSSVLGFDHASVVHFRICLERDRWNAGRAAAARRAGR